MSLKHAILGFLNYQSMTGYQLKKYFDESVGNFWSASLSQIYPTLSKMNVEGLLTVEVIHQDLSPNAKVYHITKKGKEELLDWLNSPFEMPLMRSSLLVKLYFGSNINKDQIIANLETLIDTSKKKLEYALKAKSHIEESHIAAHDMYEEAFFWSLTTDYCIKQEELLQTWGEECIRKIKGSNNKD